ncbi:YidH family protein [Actinomycetota bacterium]
MSAEPTKRWPSSVYATGEEPDPRFSLANERTFLAWIRTTLALLAGAAALDALDLPLPDRLQAVLAGLLASASLLSAAQAWLGWTRTERAMRRREPLPSPGLALPLVVVVAAVALALIAGSLLHG